MLSYGQVYDRERLDEKKTIVDLLFTACMNPKALFLNQTQGEDPEARVHLRSRSAATSQAGSFMINGRLQRRFTVATTYAPGIQVISGIYTKVLGRHLEAFGQQTQRTTEPIVNATAEARARGAVELCLRALLKSCVRAVWVQVLASIQNSASCLPQRSFTTSST